jgi:hypothetical protein
MSFYFAYGSNMCSTRLRRRVGEVGVVGCGHVVGYIHRFNKIGADGSAKGNLVITDYGVVRGVVYELSRHQLSHLSRYEGGYAPVEVSVQRESVVVTATTFLSHRIDETLQPTDDYLEHYVRGGREHGLEEYLASILPAWFINGEDD